LASRRGQDLFELDLGQHLHLRVVQPQAARAQRHLRAALLAGDVEGALPQRCSESSACSKQRGLADAGVAADQHHAALHHATAQHAVQFLVAGGGALHVLGFDVGEHRDLGRLGQRGESGSWPGRRCSATDSISVFQALQCGHLPSHLGLVPPHSLQV